ncbi:MAG TPA: sialate O-acetylesterase, partial [Chryseosolibacter sp.]
MNRHTNFRRVVILILFWACALASRAEVKPAGIFSSDMVLQRGRDIVIWGWADKGERVAITFNNLTEKTKADASGKWKLVFPRMEAGGPYEMRIQGRDKKIISLTNILIGDLWICSGQSNMGLSVKNANDAEKEIAAADYPQIRLMDIPRNMPTEPVDDIKLAQWKPCSPQSVPDFSAVAYYFGRNLFKELNIPIGLIHTSWGGSNVEAWTSLDYLTKVEKYKTYPEELAEIRKKMEPGVDIHPNKVHTSLFNGMIHPLIQLPVKGVIWYQGESNAWEGMLYRTLFPNMIQCWRDNWRQPDLPFVFVQLPGYTDE